MYRLLDRAWPFDIASIRQNAQSARNFLIGTRQILAKTVQVQLFIRPYIPQPAGIGTDLIGKYDPHVAVFIVEPAKFQFEIDEP